MGFRRFFIGWTALVAIVITVTLLYVNGLLSFLLNEVLNAFVYLAVVIPMFFVSFFIARKLETRVKEAEKEELLREDDILLQAVGLSQSVLLILVNVMLTPGEGRVWASFFIAVTAISFYSVRAWAKLKNSSKHRYYSMLVLAFVLGTTTGYVLRLFPTERNRLVDNVFNGISLAVVLIFLQMAELVFRRRYGYGSSIFARAQ